MEKSIFININFNKKLNGWIIYINKNIMITITNNNNIKFINLSKNINIYLKLLKILRQLGLIKIKNNNK